MHSSVSTTFGPNSDRTPVRASLETDSSDAGSGILYPCREQCDTPCEHPRHGEAQLRAWLQLQATLGLLPEFAIQLLRESPDPTRALRRSGEPLALGQCALDRSLLCLRERAYGLLPFASPAYPPRLAAISDPAPVLLVAGNHNLLMGPSVAIVGARAATVYGLELARTLGFRLAEAGVAVVSGLARGIDAAAHRGALEAGGPTIAVQACGPDRIYPAEHRRLAEEIRERGALMTEFPVGAPPRRPYFPLRNRLISGLSIAVVVVEARERSGSLITARHALDQGREVMAIPGAVTSATSWGPNRLIRDGAVPVLQADDVLSHLGLSTSMPVSGARTSTTAEGADSVLGSHEVRGSQPSRVRSHSTAEREVLCALAEESMTRDELGRRLGCDPQQLDLDLVNLELDGRVKLDRDGRLVGCRDSKLLAKS